MEQLLSTKPPLFMPFPTFNHIINEPFPQKLPCCVRPHQKSSEEETDRKTLFSRHFHLQQASTPFVIRNLTRPFYMLNRAIHRTAHSPKPCSNYSKLLLVNRPFYIESSIQLDDDITAHMQRIGLDCKKGENWRQEKRWSSQWSWWMMMTAQAAKKYAIMQTKKGSESVQWPLLLEKLAK